MAEMSALELELLKNIGESVKGLAARIDALAQRFDASDQNSAASRSRMHQELDANAKALMLLDHRLTTAIGGLDNRIGVAEKSIGEAAPKLRDWTDTQKKVEAAGWVGDKLYKFGIWMLACLGWIIAMREQIAAWLKMTMAGK